MDGMNMNSTDNARVRYTATQRPIKVLTSDLANKIAAGEVIERPASVVKELVENAIDAGATQIEVEVRDGGKEYIRVTDNGYGIRRDELPVAFLRHATSKIASVADLTAVLSLGFRGEALPSIASCSEVEITSCPAGAEAARLIIRGGLVEPVTAAAGAPGTTVLVRRLFYNTPARFKFLKQSATEKRYIAEYITNMALAHAEVAFRLIGDNGLLLHTPGSSDLLAAISAVHGANIAKRMIPVQWESPFLSASGFVSPPDETRPTRTYETLFVNGRWVQNRLLHSALEKGYDTMLGARRYPIAVLHLSIDPTLLDVNVHPAKTEIRFRHEGDTFKHVMLAVRGALTGANLAPRIGQNQAPATHQVLTSSRNNVAGFPGDSDSYSAHPYMSAGSPLLQGHGTFGSNQPTNPSFGLPVNTWGKGQSAYENSVFAQETAASAEQLSVAEVVPTGIASGSTVEPIALSGSLTSYSDAEFLKHLRAPLEQTEIPDEAESVRTYLQQATILGQILNTYLVIAVPFGMWLIDQHVAHERVLFEKVLSRPAGKSAQMLLTPITLQLAPAEAAWVEGAISDLAELGYELEPFGAASFLVRAVPLDLDGAPSGDGMRELFGEIASVWESSGPNRRARAAAMLACKAAIKAKQHLEPLEQRALLHSLARTNNPFACPHGRPIMIALDRVEIERRFGRR